jgi:hypothetical protein
MLKKYTKYAATAFAVASLSTFMIGCGEAAVEDTPDVPYEMPEGEDGAVSPNSTEEAPEGTDPANPSG